MRRNAICLLIFIAIFIIVRFFDFTSLWTLMSSYYYNQYVSCVLMSTLTENKTYKNESYTDNLSQSIFFKEIGFSNKAEAKRTLMELKINRKEQIVFVSYYDMFHPLVYLILNKGSKVEIDPYECNIGEIKDGISEIYFYKGERLKVVSKDKEIRELIVSILGDSTMYISGINILLGHGRTDFSDEVLALYFYLPYFIIILLAVKIDKSILISFFYFFEMIIFFGPPTHFLETSHYFIYNLLKLESINLIFGYIQLLIVSLLFIYGIYVKYKKKSVQKAKGVSNAIIVFFFILPFLLRFSYLFLDRII